MFAASLKLSNPKLPLLTARARHTVDLALIRVVAHRQNPAQNPLPADAKSLERAFHALVEAIPKRKQDDVLAKYQSLLSPAERTRVYGDLGQVNFALAKSVVEQVKALPLPANLCFSAADVASLQGQIEAKSTIHHRMPGDRPGNARAAGAAPRQAVVANTMDFAVVSATCIKPNDVRKDEINMAVGALDSFGNAFNAGPFFVGKFKKDETVNLGATGQLFAFKLTGATFPASFPAFAFMVESDWIHNNDFAQKLAVALVAAGAACAVTALSLAILGTAGVVTAPIVLPIVVATEIAALALGLLGSDVVPLLADDISFTSGDTLVLETPPAPGEVFEQAITIDNFGQRSRGTYNALFRWTAIA